MSELKTVTAAQMQALDQKAIQEYRIPSLLLMENAGRGIADIFEDAKFTKNVLIFAGKGNNGGDGLVAARHLANRGYEVTVLLLADSKTLKPDPRINFEILLKMKIPVKEIAGELPVVQLRALLTASDGVIDALFGVGIRAPLTGIYRQAVEAINESGKPVLAVDLPSGLNSDTGEVMGACIRAKITATLGMPKIGLRLKDGPLCSGTVTIVDIGIPRKELEALV